MFRISLLIALLWSVAALVPQGVNAGPPEPFGSYHLTVNLETGATTRTAAAPLAVSRLAGAQPKKVVLDRAETPSTAVRERTLAPLKGTKKIRMGAALPAGPKPSSKPVVSVVEPYIYRVVLHNIGNLQDEDHDGFYSAFNFDIGICVDISEGTLPVSAVILCTTTGQQWSAGSWDVISGMTYWADVSFDETDFQGWLEDDTYLDFSVEIYYTVGTKFDSTPYVEREPFPADPAPAPYMYEAKIINVKNTTDEDEDGYYSRFDFDIGIDADDPYGQALVSAVITCDTTGQSWCTEQSWEINGIQRGYARIGFSERDFGAHVTGDTDLDFTVELYNSTFSVLYDETTQVGKEPFKADPLPPYLAVAKIYNLSGLLDLDRDGYYAQFAFDIGIDADVPQVPAEVAARITCTTTGQAWDTASWTVEGVGEDFANVRFDQSDFADYLSGNTNLDFTVELYDGTLSYLLDTKTAVGNEPFRADTGLPRIAEAKIYNRANLKDEDADGYYSQYDFDLGINAVVDTGALSVAGRILCPVTGQTWNIAPWTITAGTESWKNVRFNEARFAGHLAGNTQLYFTVEIYDATWAARLDSTSSVGGQPFSVDPIQAPDDAYALVRHFYNSVLAREPEPGAVDAWINGYFLYSLYLEIDVRFIGREMGRIFFFSPEYANRNRDNAEFITDCYQAFLWRNPSDAELAAWLGGVWNRAEAMTIFAESEEFDELMSVQWFPGYEGKPVRNFTTTMYIGFLDRLPDLGGLDYWSAILEQAADKRQRSKEMVLAILRSAEYLGRNEPASATVTRLYRSFMGRFPGDGEAAYWTDEIASGRRTLEQVVSAFGNSEEFTMRLKEYF
jgi:hypothetical protein